MAGANNEASQQLVVKEATVCEVLFELDISFARFKRIMPETYKHSSQIDPPPNDTKLSAEKVNNFLREQDDNRELIER